MVAGPSRASAQSLVVPYLPQTEDLCGGAAAAMVMRYWGASDAYPDAFSPLVDRAAGGIRTSALTDELTRQGWTVAAGPGDNADMVRALGRGRPVIALIQDRPGRFHYVVVIGIANGHVVLHDPARAPSRTVDAKQFDTAWQVSERWMLILLPPASGLPSGNVLVAATPHDSEPTPTTECATRVTDAVVLAGQDRGAARDALMHATVTCPQSAAAWRELAGLDALDTQWKDAAVHAERAVTLDPEDALGWQILATARYLQHDDLGSLAAWNRIGGPTVNLIDVTGLQRTRYGVIADAIGVGLKSMLTPEAMKLAERRVQEIPSVASARVTFHPVENGRAQITAAVLERDRAPIGWGSWIGMGFTALTDRQVSATLSSMTGGGEATGVTWRWWQHRPMVSAFYAAPAPRLLGGGVWRLEASRETQTFGREPFAETRTRAAMTLGNWISDRTRLAAGAAVERWTNRANDVAMTGSIDHWRLANRVRLQADVTSAFGADPFTTAGVTAAARTQTAQAGFVLFGLAGYRVASGSSPASVWPSADTGQASDVLLRAHPLLTDGIVTGGAFGRRLASGTLEAQRWTALHHLPGSIAPAAFLDIARAERGLNLTDPRLHVDAGLGLRLTLPGAGVMRIDIARGIRDGGTVVSAGWDRRWR